jgi:hypothetical protein
MLADPRVPQRAERSRAFSENKKVPHFCETFSFLVEPWGIEPQTSRVRLLTA